jgi:hypothetical protein
VTELSTIRYERGDDGIVTLVLDGVARTSELTDRYGERFTPPASRVAKARTTGPYS